MNLSLCIDVLGNVFIRSKALLAQASESLSFQPLQQLGMWTLTTKCEENQKGYLKSLLGNPTHNYEKLGPFSVPICWKSISKLSAEYTNSEMRNCREAIFPSLWPANGDEVFLFLLLLLILMPLVHILHSFGNCSCFIKITFVSPFLARSFRTLFTDELEKDHPNSSKTYHL